MRSYFPYAFIKNITEKTTDVAIKIEQVTASMTASLGGIVCRLYLNSVRHAAKLTAKNIKKFKDIKKRNIIFFNLSPEMNRELLDF